MGPCSCFNRLLSLVLICSGFFLFFFFVSLVVSFLNASHDWKLFHNMGSVSCASARAISSGIWNSIGTGSAAKNIWNKNERSVVHWFTCLWLEG